MKQTYMFQKEPPYWFTVFMWIYCIGGYLAFIAFTGFLSYSFFMEGEYFMGFFFLVMEVSLLWPVWFFISFLVPDWMTPKKDKSDKELVNDKKDESDGEVVNAYMDRIREGMIREGMIKAREMEKDKKQKW